ncbi:MAG: hypothetical protein P1U63_07120 [Coxiellaceae bacterium]|nr:hypothetical protein [Coxiellaceae bacterium]
MYYNTNERLNRQRQLRDEACLRNLKWSLATVAVLGALAGCVYYMNGCLSIEADTLPAAFDIESVIDPDSTTLACLETSTNDISLETLSTLNQTLVQLTHAALFTRSSNDCKNSTFLGIMSHSCDDTVFSTSAADGSDLRHALGLSLEASGGTLNRGSDFDGMSIAMASAIILILAALPLLVITTRKTIDAVNLAKSYRTLNADILGRSLLTDPERATATDSYNTTNHIELQVRQPSN